MSHGEGSTFAEAGAELLPSRCRKENELLTLWLSMPESAASATARPTTPPRNCPNEAMPVA